MKRVLPATLAAAAILSVAITPVLAESTDTATNSSKVQLLKQRVEETANKTLTTTKAEAINLRDKIASKESELKDKLAKFKDQKKAEKVQQVNDTLNKINKDRTDMFTKYLDKMSDILTKVEKIEAVKVAKRTNTATQSGSESSDSAKTSTESAQLAISEAKASIATAKAAVTAQAAKDYTISVTTETSARAAAKTSRDKLHADLLSLLKTVTDAKKAVANAIKVVAISK